MDQERAADAMKAALTEQTERLAEEMERSREAAAEAAFETQMAIDEAADQQRRAMAKSIAEHKRIAANAWKIQAQAKSDQAYQLYKSGLLAEALQLAIQAVNEDPGNIHAVSVAGACLKNQGKTAEAHPYLAKQVQMLKIPEYRSQMRFHLKVLDAIESDAVLTKMCCKVIRENLRDWSPCDSIASSNQLVLTLIENEEFELAVLVQQWMLQSWGVNVDALVGTRKIFCAMAGSSAGLEAARPELNKIVQWLESPHNVLGARRAGAGTDRISLLGLAFALEFTSLLGEKTEALDSYFKNLSFEKRGDFEREFKSFIQTVSLGEIDQEAAASIMESAKQKYSSWESYLQSQLHDSVVLQVKNSPKDSFGCLTGIVWLIVLVGLGLWPMFQVGGGKSPIPFSFPAGLLIGTILLGTLTAKAAGSFRRYKKARILLDAELDRQNKAFEELGLPRILRPDLNIRSPKAELAVYSGIALAFIVSWQVLLFTSITRPPSTSYIGGNGVVDDLAGQSVGNAYGIQWIHAIGNRGAVFTAADSSRIEYPGVIPLEGTVEFWIKVDSGYQYVNYAFQSNQDSAMIFSSDVQGGDVTWPGTTKVYVKRNGDVSLWMATVKGLNRNEPTEARGTKFRFGQWHAIGVSYGRLGQFIMLDGKLVASAPSQTQTFGQAGTDDAPVDLPTIGETVSHVWQHHRYEGGFEGTLAAFRASGKQNDWSLARGISSDLEELGALNGGTPNTSRQTDTSVPQDFSNEINVAIANWRDAELANDPARLADCYAGTIDRYFLQTNVTHDFVKQYIQKLHDRGDLFKYEAISQISLERISDLTVEAQFIESFDILTAGQDKGRTVRTILHFIKEGGSWKISYERQLNIS